MGRDGLYVGGDTSPGRRVKAGNAKHNRWNWHGLRVSEAVASGQWPVVRRRLHIFSGWLLVVQRRNYRTRVHFVSSRQGKRSSLQAGQPALEPFILSKITDTGYDGYLIAGKRRRGKY
jgi:hypothetical protein